MDTLLVVRLEVMLEEMSGLIDLTLCTSLVEYLISNLLLCFRFQKYMFSYYPLFLVGLLEAMSIGCSIVASQGLPVSEVITDGVEGLLVQ